MDFFSDAIDTLRELLQLFVCLLAETKVRNLIELLEEARLELIGLFDDFP